MVDPMFGDLATPAGFPVADTASWRVISAALGAMADGIGSRQQARRR